MILWRHFDQCGVEIPQDDAWKLHDSLQSLTRIRAVADDVAETVDLINLVRFYVLKDRFQGFKIPVDVADDCRLHGKFVSLVVSVSTGSFVKDRCLDSTQMVH